MSESTVETVLPGVRRAQLVRDIDREIRTMARAMGMDVYDAAALRQLLGTVRLDRTFRHRPYRLNGLLALRAKLGR